MVKEPSKIADEKAFELIKRIVALPKQFFCKNEKELEAALKRLNFPLVMKVSGKNIIHKTELKGVKIVNSEEEARKEFARMKKIKGCEKVLLQEFIQGIETIVGIKKDETFGQVIAFGLGGIWVEVLKDVSFRVCPISKEDAEEMIKEIKGYEILLGKRGEKVNIERLVEVLVAISKFAVKQNISEMDINPLICNSQNCFAVDVRIFR
jgi:succinyl-CoA synthetase beta subunit